jgi:hypothetical protein
MAKGSAITSEDDVLVVITGLVPVISIKKSTAPQTIEMAGTSPAMTSEG